MNRVLGSSVRLRCGTHNIYANNLMYGNASGNYAFDSPCPNTSTEDAEWIELLCIRQYTGQSAAITI